MMDKRKPSAIQFENFSFQYEAQAEKTLHDLTIDIPQGNKVLIIGPSGSGKSTLGQCINGIIPHIYQGTAQGRLLINGQEIYNCSIYDRSSLVSTVLQDPDGQFIGLSVAEDIAFALENDNVSPEPMRSRVAEWADRLDLKQHLHARPQELSGGQKQRVSLAGVLIDESPILLFDEPLANLDPKAGQDTIALIDRIHKETNSTTVIIEHRLEDVLYRSVDQVILINEGRVCFDGSPDELLKTTLLQENGIREPLYVSSLRDMGYDLQTIPHLEQLDCLNLDGVTYQLDLPQENIDIKKVPLLAIEGLTFGYDTNQPILKDISLTIHKGERLAVVGKNGAGKSTLAKVLCQFVKSQGKITYQGQDISEDSIKERAEKIGYVLQNPNQMISQTQIFDEVALGLRLRQVPEEEVTERVYEALQVCGLYEMRKWPISALSFGQKKRVTVAAILVLKPEIILLDEPTAGQDYRHYKEMMIFLDSLRDQGHTIVMITHDMQLMLEYTDRVVVVSAGQIIADDKPQAILNQVDQLEVSHLKKTSLYQLAEKLSLDPEQLTQYYITERKKQEQ